MCPDVSTTQPFDRARGARWSVMHGWLATDLPKIVSRKCRFAVVLATSTSILVLTQPLISSWLYQNFKSNAFCLWHKNERTQKRVFYHLLNWKQNVVRMALKGNGNATHRERVVSRSLTNVPVANSVNIAIGQYFDMINLKEILGATL